MVCIKDHVKENIRKRKRYSVSIGKVSFPIIENMKSLRHLGIYFIAYRSPTSKGRLAAVGG